jgi:hypothetical protein
MASLAAFPQFRTDPIVNRVLRIDKPLQIVGIVHQVLLMPMPAKDIQR